MKKIINLFMFLGMISFMTGCATEVMKAPCDHQGHFCGHKIKINQW